MTFNHKFLTFRKRWSILMASFDRKQTGTLNAGWLATPSDETGQEGRRGSPHIAFRRSPLRGDSGLSSGESQPDNKKHSSEWHRLLLSHTQTSCPFCKSGNVAKAALLTLKQSRFFSFLSGRWSRTYCSYIVYGQTQNILF